MSRRALNQGLDRLRTELAASSSLSAAERKRLETLLGDVRAHVEGEGDEHEPQSLADRLHEAKEQFEESHPNLTLAIGAVADALSRLGI
jgi:uncharacterized protein DUF4404